MGAWSIGMVFEPLEAQEVGQIWGKSQEGWFMYWRYYINLNGVRGKPRHQFILLILDFFQPLRWSALLFDLGAWLFKLFAFWDSLMVVTRLNKGFQHRRAENELITSLFVIHVDDFVASPSSFEKF